VDPPLKSWITSATRLVAIEYHTSFPYLGDPFYQANIEEQEARLLQSGVTFVPSIRFDALHTPAANNPTAYGALLTERRAVPSGTTVDLAGTLDPAGLDGRLTVTVTPGEAMPGDWHLWVAIIENAIDYEAPNGIDVHDQVFRDFLPDAEGTAIDLATAGAPVTVELDYTLDASWNELEVRFVAFVQEATTRIVDQAGELRIGELTPVAPATWGAIKHLYRRDR
jgi:hypothetical protein